MEEMGYIVVLEDDPTVAPLLKKSLGVPRAITFSRIEDLRKRSNQLQPQALFVDVHLEGEEVGLECLPWARERWPDIPILVITADTSQDCLAKAFSLGADDFVRKPLVPAEIRARCLARSEHHRKTKEDSELRYLDLCLNLDYNLLRGPAAHPVSLTPLETRVLRALLESRGILMERLRLQAKVWGGIQVGPTSLDRLLTCLRKKLQDVESAALIESHYARGICLRIPRPLGATGNTR